MSYDALRWACELALPAHEKIVLVQLAHRHNRDTGKCNPSLERLAKDTGLSKATVCRATKKLAEIGLVARIQRFNDRAQVSTDYILGLGTIPVSNGDTPLSPTETAPVSISDSPCLPQTTPLSPTETQTRNKNKEVNKGVVEPSSSEIEGTGISIEDYRSYMLVLKRKKKGFIDLKARDRWLMKWRKFYAEGKDTTDMIGQMIEGHWQGAVDEKWRMRKKEWVEVTDPAEAWPELYGKGNVLQ